MKRKNLLCLCVILTLVLTLGAITLVVGAEEEPSVSVERFNLVFEDNVYLKYAVSFTGVDDSEINSSNIGMLYFTEPKEDYTKGGETHSSGVVGFTTLDGKKVYTFEYRHITAKQMTEYVYSVAYMDIDGERYYSEPVKFSVLEYCYAKLGKIGTDNVSTNEEFKSLLVSTLNYGADAQKYFDYNEDRLANDEYYRVEVVGGTLEDGFTKGLYHTGETATLTAAPAGDGMSFSGWKNGGGEIVSKANPYEITEFTANETYTATYEKEQAPLYTRDGDYIYFGEYPQSLKADDVVITTETDSRGYYLGSDGYYYAKVVANPYESGYKFSTGVTVNSGTVYYFKVEPIRWRILTTDGENALILCDSIIANMAYDAGYNINYAESDIRAWINDNFYKIAFTELQREVILTTTVDNSVYSTGYSSNPNVCEDTKDKIFLLSHREVTNSAYGFESSYFISDTARIMQTSDYSRATGVWMSTDSSYYGNGYWWLRSPYSSNRGYARNVRLDGSAHGISDLRNAEDGVVPALWINI